jgi:YVTN family beta-propeller protein
VIAVRNSDRSVMLFDSGTGKTVVRLPLPFAPRRYCVSSDGGQLFLSGDGMDAVTIVYPYQSEIAETILAGRSPGAMAATSSYLLVTNPASNSVTVLNIDDRRLVAVVQVGQGPREILMSPDGQYALVLNERSGDLAVIWLYALTEPRAHRYKSASLFTLIPVGDKPVGAAVVTL